ncbi:hypothetical protein D915_002177 [Fasciola hepatica]|uniref:Protein KRI1 homolog n=1 Tax=Fasciola hepatica TaxID=6192 RepID=A0A4E0RXU7_FASHE|nr:hypothetical protein D915_002177 [Fasciola hepatica]
MQFSINKDFANRYNTYRKKEELQRLKERYGDVELKKKSKKDLEKSPAEQSNADDITGSSDSSSNSSDDDTYSSSAEREHEDFLVLYEALCKNDPQLNDPSKQWFHDSENPTESESGVSAPVEATSLNNDATATNTDTETQGIRNKKKNKKVEKSNKHDVVTLRDYDRQFLLEEGGVEEESRAVEAEKIAKLESDVLLSKLEKSDANDSKALFIQEADVALKRIGVKVTDQSEVTEASTTEGFLVRRQPETAENERKRSQKVEVNVENLLFTDQPNSEAEAFLRDYIINQRWRRPSERIPTYSEVLRSANVNIEETEAGDASSNAIGTFEDCKILDEDDDFLIRVRDFERNQLESRIFKQPVKHRFEEEDKEFIKSYPRKIETSIHQIAATQARSSRTEKRQARMQRKREEKKAKMAELDRLRRLKLSLYAEKIERIKRSCGAGCDLTTELGDGDVDNFANAVDKAETEKFVTEKPEKARVSDCKKPNAKTALALAMHLDEDWDPEKHDQLLGCMFDESYYETHEDPSQIPRFSDDSDNEEEGEEDEVDTESDSGGANATKQDDNNRDRDTSVDTASASRRKIRVNQLSLDSQMIGSKSGVEKQEDDDQPGKVHRRRRLRGKARLRRALEREKDVYDPSVYPDFETYFQKYYKLNCEDVIPGPTPDEDIFCRFKYRKVIPNDFGLSTEDVLTATPGELNSWVPIHRITAYRTEDEEERDQRLFHSNHKLQKKNRVISSLNDPDAHWWPSTKAKSDTKSTSGGRRKRSKRKRNRERAHDDTEQEVNVEVPQTSESIVKSPKKTKYQKLNGVSISAARLLASGLTIKDLHKARKRKRKSDPDHSMLSFTSV